MNTRQLLGAALLAGAAWSAQAGVTFGSNLIVNGGAEAGTTGWSTYDVYSPIQAVDYGVNWVRPDQPGPDDRGTQMFTGTGAYAVAWQLLDLGDATTVPQAFTLSGWLGGWLGQGDNALLYAAFLGTDDSEIGSAALGPVGPADRGSATGLFYREVADWLPVGTAKVTFWLSMERQGGGDNDGYADNLAFVLAAPAAVPEPAGLAWLGLGVLALPSLARRRSAQR